MAQVLQQVGARQVDTKGGRGWRRSSSAGTATRSQADQRKIKAHRCSDFKPLGGRIAPFLRPLLSGQSSKFQAPIFARQRACTVGQRKLVLTQADQRKVREHRCGDFWPISGRIARLLRPLLSGQSSKITGAYFARQLACKARNFAEDTPAVNSCRLAGG